MLLHDATPPPAHVRIAETDAFAGSITYDLTCGPAGGTLPRARRACRALRREPALLRRRAEGQPFPCPSGLPSFHVTGVYAGRRIDARFIACTSGQGPIAQRWGELVPSDLARLRVAPGRGIGLVRLGEPEARVRRLRTGFGFAFRGGRVVSITSGFPATTIEGVQIASGLRVLRRRLHGWRSCGPRALFRGSGPSTVVSARRVTVAVGPANCGR
jgi:hypothetical protein